MSSENPELLSQVMAAARKQNDSLMEKFAGREDEIDELEDEIIKNYTNNDDTKLASVPDHVQIQVTLSSTQRHLSRITEIHTEALRNYNKLQAVKAMLMDSLLPLMTGGSADLRTAKANDCTQGINYMIALEQGLINICELATKNLKTAQETASRTLKAYELDLQSFDGANTFSVMVAASKRKYLNG